ncbi:MAG: PilZ domain-containing protein [Kordiimonadaceae bacterium]|nr:PilZ domain-containing protein [Kordiimonadaceae bacterium]
MSKTTVDKKVSASEAGGANDAGDHRNFRRRSVLWPAQLLIGQHTFTCQIWNLSLGDARVRIDLPFQEGTNLKLVIADRGEIPSVVSWSVEGSMGLEFQVGANTVRKMFKDRLHVLGLDEEP